MGVLTEDYMDGSKRNPAIPAWPEDEPGCGMESAQVSPYFDRALETWVVTSYADVNAALHDPALWPGKGRQSEPIDRESHRQMRETTRQSLSPKKIKHWDEGLRARAKAAAAVLKTDAPVDLLSSYAIPACMWLAETVTSVSREEALLLFPAAEIVSSSAAEPYDSDLKKRAEPANELLKEHFKGRAVGRGESTFVAITQTIPALMANAWFALTQAPQQWGGLHRRPDLVEASVDELMRCGGFLRVLDRYATADTEVGGVTIHEGERLVLRLAPAHRDPKRYSQPDELLVDRGAKGILSLGAGEHSCVGAGLIRMALAAFTGPLVARFSHAELARPVVWRGGSTFRTPESLWVRLHERSMGVAAE
jgi:cytochrome P450